MHETKSTDWLTRYVHGLLQVPGKDAITRDLKKLHAHLKQKQEKS